MSDAISGQMAQQAATAVQEVGGAQAMDEAQPQGQSFDAALGEQQAQVDEVGDVGDLAQVDAVQESEEVASVSEIPTDDFVQQLLSEEGDIQAMMERCMSGEDLDQQEMLQMQAVIYTYSQRVELTTKVVQQATSGLDKMMNTQV